MRKYQAIYSSGVSIIETEHVNTSWIAGGNRKAFIKTFHNSMECFLHVVLFSVEYLFQYLRHLPAQS